MTKRPQKLRSDHVVIQVEVRGPFGRGDREIEAAVSHAVQQALQQYDADLQSRVHEISNDPRLR